MINDTSIPRVIQIPLGNGLFAIIDEVDSDLLRFNWHYQKGYVARATILIHRVILSRMLNRPLEKYELVDHENHNGLDNTRKNLRLASRAQNQQNRKVNRNNKSGYKGVTYYKSRDLWRASITIDGRCKTLGYYDTPEMAAHIYNQAALKYFGEFAKLNELPTSFEPMLYQPRPIGRPKSANPRQARIKSKGKRGPNSLNKSGYKGVTFHKRNNTWYAHIFLNGKDVHLGTFYSAKEAAQAYNKAALEAFGNDVYLNPIED